MYILSLRRLYMYIICDLVFVVFDDLEELCSILTITIHHMLIYTHGQASHSFEPKVSKTKHISNYFLELFCDKRREG